jgi:hypothetical protein
MLRLAQFRRNNPVLRVGKRSEAKLRNFGYGLYYRNISESQVSSLRHGFKVIFKEKFIPTLIALNRNIERSSHTVIVVHDYRDISENVILLVKNYNLITMRKTVQEYLKSKYELDSSFIYHPFLSLSGYF